MNEYELKYKLLISFFKNVLESDDTTYGMIEKLKNIIEMFNEIGDER